MQIQDGSGSGHWVKVDSYNRLHTHSVVLTESSFISEKNAQAFSISTDILTFNSLNEHPFVWIRNDDPNKKLVFSSVIYSHNGGNTTGNKTMIKRVYRNIPEPTDNYSSMTPYNLNFGSLNSALMTIYCWDESANDGMTVDYADEISFSTSTVQKGTLTLADIEAVILPYNSSILFTYQPEEIGTAAFSGKIYFNFEHC